MNFEMFAKLDDAGHIVRPPHSAILPDGREIINCHLSAEWLAANGYEEHDQAWFDEHTPQVEPYVPDETAFLAACQQFKTVCSQIGAAIGNPEFRGGFDEMLEFQQSEVFSTVSGLQLAMSWSAANEYAKYEGQKLGYGQPAWWYRCWELLDSTENTL